MKQEIEITKSEYEKILKEDLDLVKHTVNQPHAIITLYVPPDEPELLNYRLKKALNTDTFKTRYWKK